MSEIGNKIVNNLTKFRDHLKGKSMSAQKSTKTPSLYVKPRIAKIYPPEEGRKKMTMVIPGVNVYETVVMADERLSVMVEWAEKYGYKVDLSLLNKPVKPKYVPPEDSEYSYR